MFLPVVSLGTYFSLILLPFLVLASSLLLVKLSEHSRAGVIFLLFVFCSHLYTGVAQARAWELRLESHGESEVIDEQTISVGLILELVDSEGFLTENLITSRRLSAVSGGSKLGAYPDATATTRWSSFMPRPGCSSGSSSSG